MQQKEKIDKWDYIRLKTFCASKDITNNVKRQATEWEKIFANHISDEINIQNIERTSQPGQQSENPSLQNFSKISWACWPPLVVPVTGEAEAGG